MQLEMKTVLLNSTFVCLVVASGTAHADIGTASTTCYEQAETLEQDDVGARERAYRFCLKTKIATSEFDDLNVAPANALLAEQYHQLAVESERKEKADADIETPGSLFALESIHYAGAEGRKRVAVRRSKIDCGEWAKPSIPLKVRSIPPEVMQFQDDPRRIGHLFRDSNDAIDNRRFRNSLAVAKPYSDA